jgi:L-amino acid N-acyltransferase YncA
MNIKKIEKNDRDLLLNFFSELVIADPERVERPEDVNKITKDDEEKWIEKRLTKENDKEIFVLCGLDETGKIVTEGEVERMTRWVEKHVAEIRFGVLPNHELIAEVMLENLIETAKNNNIEVLIYFHLETQKKGIEIMEKLGFESAGVIKKYYKKGDKYINRIYLVKYL